MTQTAWAHLPNAKHIDWVLASLKAHPEKWEAARNVARNAAGDASWYAAWTAARNAARYVARTAALDASWTAARDAAWYEAKAAVWDAVWDAAWGAARNAAYEAAADAIIALIAYDDCGYMIESEVGELKIIAAFGNQPAILLLPACIVFNETKVLV